MENKHKAKIEKNNNILDKIRRLQEIIKNDLLIEIPTYIIDEIVTGGRKDNVIALLGLARINDRIKENEVKIFIRNLDKYIVN